MTQHAIVLTAQIGAGVLIVVGLMAIAWVVSR